MKNFIQEFKAFAVRGNAIDLAVGVVIGAAFGQITNALVNNVLTPPIGLLIGNANFADLSVTLAPDVVIRYGAFLQALLNFVLIALALFLVVKGINLLHRKKEKEAPPAPAESEELKVLKDIRDRLARPK